MPLQIDILDIDNNTFLPFASIPNGKRTSLRAIDIYSIPDYQLYSHESGRFSEICDDIGRTVQRVQLLPYTLEASLTHKLKCFGTKLRFTNI